MTSEPRFQSSTSLDVVGIGNAIVDVLVQTDDGFLQAHGLQKGGMALIDEPQAERLYKASGPGLETSGGSVANTMVGIAQLGVGPGSSDGSAMTSSGRSSATTSGPWEPVSTHRQPPVERPQPVA